VAIAPLTPPARTLGAELGGPDGSSDGGEMSYLIRSAVVQLRLWRRIGWNGYGAGVDLSPLAVELVSRRISDDRGLFGGATALDEPPLRTDLEDLPNYRTHRHRLYGEQEGVCVGCTTHFPFRVMEVDHILPRSRGGTDHADDLQLLCSGCNRSKGGKTMAEWRAG